MNWTSDVFRGKQPIWMNCMPTVIRLSDALCAVHTDRYVGWKIRTSRLDKNCRLTCQPTNWRYMLQLYLRDCSCWPTVGQRFFLVSANENLSGRSVGPNSSTDTRKTSADMNRLIERAATVIRRFVEQTCRPTEIFCRSDLSADKSASECIRQPIFLIALNLTIGSLNDSKFRNCC